MQPIATENTPSHVSGPTSAAAVRLHNVGYQYAPDGPMVLHGVTMSVAPGERLGLLGPNGGGKSTLIKIIMGLLSPTEGSVEVLGTSPGAARRAQRVGYVPQRVTAELRFPVSVREVIGMTADARTPALRRTPREIRERVERLIALLTLDPIADRQIGTLSGGQLQRVMIARALCLEPELLLLDEPTVGIDISGQRRFADLVTTIGAELGLAIITVSHDLRTVAAASDRVACLRRGLHYHDAPDGLTPTVLAELFTHDVEALFGEDGAHRTADEAAARVESSHDSGHHHH